MIRHLSSDQLNGGLEHIRQSPANHGTLDLIVIRPADLQRTELAHCDVSFRGGVHGDMWAKGCWKSLPDGSPDPDVQVTLANRRAIGLMAGDRSRWPLAGDQLYVDLDLSDENLPPGSRISIGTAILQITHIPHNGCRLFQERFGGDALAFVNSDEGKRLRLRGVYARVVQDGRVAVGDAIATL